MAKLPYICGGGKEPGYIAMEILCNKIARFLMNGYRAEKNLQE